MKKGKSKDDFNQWMTLAGKALELDMNGIKAEFYDYWLCIETYYEKGLKHTCIDIRLNDSTKLFCSLNETGKCQTVTLYPPATTDINDCITLLNTHYVYDFIYGSWEYNSCFINIQPVNNHYRLVFQKNNLI